MQVNENIQNFQQFLEETQRRITSVNAAIPRIQQAVIAIHQLLGEFDKLQADVTYVQRAVETLRQFTVSVEPDHATVHQNTPASIGEQPRMPTPVTMPQHRNVETPEILQQLGGHVDLGEHKGPTPVNPPGIPYRHPVSEEIGRLVESAQSPQNLQTLSDGIGVATSVLRSTLQSIRESAPGAAPNVPQKRTDHTAGLMATFVGFRSMFAQALSPEIMTGGRGFMKPGFARMQYFAQDILEEDYGMLVQWSSGFYTSKKTRSMQLFLNTAAGLVLLDPIDMNAEPLVMLLGADRPKSWIPVSQLDEQMMIILATAISSVFKQLENNDRVLTAPKNQ